MYYYTINLLLLYFWHFTDNLFIYIHIYIPSIYLFLLSLPFCLSICLYLRYLVDQRWLKQWKKYSGFDSWDQYHAGSEAVNPGPVDNSNLFKGR